MLAFTGAGISVPLAPAWSPFLRKLISDGAAEGFIPKDELEYLEGQIDDDPLELASTLEELYTKERFRSNLQTVFGLNEKSTETQDKVIVLPFETIITLNYDDGLSTAYVRKYQRIPVIIKPDDTYELVRWQQGQAHNAGQLPIIHWHGNISAPDKIVLTADDYNKFYSKPEISNFISDLWKTRSLLAIGFGFKDPFLVRLAEGILRTLPAGNSHYALIGHSGEGVVSGYMRRQFARKFRLTPIFYQIKTDDEGGEDHSALTVLLEYLKYTCDQKAALAVANSEVSAPERTSSSGTVLDDAPLSKAKSEFEKHLLVGTSEQLLYVEPRLYAPPSITDDFLDEASRRVTVDSLVRSDCSFAIMSPYEHGGTTLGRRLVYDILSRGEEAHFADARELPFYKAKLQALDMFRKRTPGRSRTLVLDQVSAAVHERLLKEIIGLKSFDRIILISRGTSAGASDITDLDLAVDFIPLTLSQLQREDIRTLATVLYNTFDADMVSAAVEKTYNDLLDLCIPLTPSNVIMYLSVIYREGSFIALNRIQIMDRYIRDLLQRPSDVYRDSFNVDNKIELLSGFVYWLFGRNSSTFTGSEWRTFCKAEMERSLSYFDMETLLADLVANRVIIAAGSIYIFRYKLFYSYLLGRYVGERPELLPSFIENEHHLAVDSLVETIAGTSKDNTLLVTSLTERLEESIRAFDEQYQIGELDPYQELEWSLDEDEESKVWQPIAESLAQGPAQDSEVDRVKRSIVAEQRTADQAVIVREFNRIERSISYNQSMLMTAIRESPTLGGALKIRATQNIFRAYELVMQIGFSFAPIIATRRYFVWNNIAFVNKMNFTDEQLAKPEWTASVIAGAIPRAVTDRAVTEIGSKKLGEVYKHMSVNLNPIGFELLLLYSLIIRSKPQGWEAQARAIVGRVDRRALYLRYMLGETMKQFRHEVNSNADRAALKKLVATVQAKRGLKKVNPSSKAISGVLKKLEDRLYFDPKDPK